MSGAGYLPVNDHRYMPGVVFRPIEDDLLEGDEALWNDNPRRRRGRRRSRSKGRRRSRGHRRNARKGRMPAGLRRYWAKHRRGGGRTRTRRHRRNPRFGKHRPVLSYGPKGWRAPRRSRSGIRGYRVNRRRGRSRRHRSNPRWGFKGVKECWKLPRKGDFTKHNAGAAIGGILGGLILPSLVGYAWEYGLNKLDTSKVIPAEYKGYVVDVSRILIKTVSGMGMAYAFAKITKRPVVGKFFMLGTVIAVILDIIGTVAKYVMKQVVTTIIPPAVQDIIDMMTPKLPFTGYGIAIHALGFGQIHHAYTMGKIAKAAPHMQGVRILAGPKGNHILVGPYGVIRKGDARTISGTYRAMAMANVRGSFGDMVTVEAGYRGSGGREDGFQ